MRAKDEERRAGGSPGGWGTAGEIPRPRVGPRKAWGMARKAGSCVPDGGSCGPERRTERQGPPRLFRGVLYLGTRAWVRESVGERAWGRGRMEERGRVVVLPQSRASMGMRCDWREGGGGVVAFVTFSFPRSPMPPLSHSPFLTFGGHAPGAGTEPPSVDSTAPHHRQQLGTPIRPDHWRPVAR